LNLRQGQPNFGKDGNTQPIDAKVSQEPLAEMIGTTRSRVSYFMNKFRRLGFISYDGTIEVHRSFMNAVLCDRLRSTSKIGSTGFER
jgi:CRP/FNR family cyclic AMP-dependent transcriptional regulator